MATLTKTKKHFSKENFCKRPGVSIKGDAALENNVMCLFACIVALLLILSVATQGAVFVRPCN